MLQCIMNFVREAYEPAGRTARALAADIEDAIVSGVLEPGDLLPPMREVVKRNGIASATVASAYRILRDRGLVAGDRRRGTRVIAEPPLAAHRAVLLPPGVRDLSDGNPDPTLLPDLLPRLRRLPQPLGVYQEMVNIPDLVEAAARRIRADGVPTAALAVVHGAMDGIERILRLHVRAGDRIAIEDPGYSSIVDIARSLNLNIVPIPMDDRGPRPEALGEKLARHRPKALIVTPRAQNPSGAAWDVARRDDVRGVIQKCEDLLVIEDDHAGPIAGRAYLPLGGYATRPWAVVRSVSKSFGPDLRLAVVAGSDRLIDRLEGSFSVGPGWVSHIIQRLVADLFNDPAVDGQLETAAGVYHERRETLIASLAVHGVESTSRSGLNVWVPVPREEQVVTGMLSRGWAVAAGERFRLQSPPAVRVTTARLKTSDAPAVASALAAAIFPASRARLA